MHVTVITQNKIANLGFDISMRFKGFLIKALKNHLKYYEKYIAKY